MIIKDEEKNLVRCLNSLVPLMGKIESELIIVDTGSTDGSIEIAKRYTDKVYFHKWNDNFSEMRNISIGYAKGEWILIIDADEELKSYDHIIEFLKSDEHNKYNVATLFCRNIMGNSEYNSISLVTPRLFKNNGIFKYIGAIHNKPVASGLVKDLQDGLIHYGYMMTDKELIEKKFKRTSEMLIKELIEDPDNYYYRYQISVSYYTHGDYDKALHQCEKAYKFMKNNGIDLRENFYIYSHLVKCLAVVRNFERAKLICEESILVEKDQLDMYCFLGEILVELKEYDKAIGPFNKYLDLLNNFRTLSIVNERQMYFEKLEYAEKVYYYLSVIFYNKKEYKKALKYSKLIKLEEILRDSIPIFLESFIKLDKYEELGEYCRSIIIKNENISENLFGYLERTKENVKHEKLMEFYKALSEGNDQYSILNKLRLAMLDRNELEMNIINNFFYNINFNILPEYYGDALYYCINYNIDFYSYLINVTETNIIKYLLYLEKKNANFINVLESYSDNYINKNEFTYIKVNRIIFKFFMAAGNYEDNKYKDIFYKYINIGTKYIDFIYTKELTENEWISDIENKEEVFLIYMKKAYNLKETDEINFIKLLNKSLKVYPEMKKGIEILFNEIKEKQNSTNNEMEKLKIQLKDNIRHLIYDNKLDKAIDLIDEYFKINSDDIEIYSMRAVVYIMLGSMNEAEKVLKKGLIIDSENFDLNYNLAYLYEQKSLYLKALETYEKIVFNMEDSEQRQQIIAYLNELEDKHRDVIQKQLEESRENEEVVREGTEKKLNLHIMIDSPYSKKFIQMVNENFDIEEHYFIITTSSNKLNYLDDSEYTNLSVVNLNQVEYECSYKILKYINICSKVFVHLLTDYMCNFLVRYTIEKEVNWVLWGVDLYNFIDMNLFDDLTAGLLNKKFSWVRKNIKNNINYILRKVAIRKFSNIYTEFDDDFLPIKENFITAAVHGKLVYPNPVNFVVLENQSSQINQLYNFKPKYKFVIQVGNSGDPSNNHLEIFQQLKKIYKKDFCVISPLSYGDSDYINEIIIQGKNLLGERFIPLKEFLKPEEYFKILKQVDVSIMNHNRQQASSNMSILLYLGKKLYAKEHISTAREFKRLGVKLFNVSELRKINFEQLIKMNDEDKEKNKRIIFEYFSDEKILMYLKAIFK